MSGYKESTLLNISKIGVVLTEYEDAPSINSLAFEWVEMSPDPWYSDQSASIDIDKEDAEKLVRILTSHFKID